MTATGEILRFLENGGVPHLLITAVGLRPALGAWVNGGLTQLLMVLRDIVVGMAVTVGVGADSSFTIRNNEKRKVCTCYPH